MGFEHVLYDHGFGKIFVLVQCAKDAIFKVGCKAQ